jgi:hypothetical protein
VFPAPEVIARGNGCEKSTVRALPPGRSSATLAWTLAEIGFLVRYVACASVTAEAMYCTLSLMTLCGDMMRTCLSRYLKLQKALFVENLRTKQE